MLMLGIYSAPPSNGGSLILDATPFASGVRFSTNEHGFEQLTAYIRLPLQRSFQLYDQLGMMHVGVYDNGSIVWEGRLEDISINQDGINITALGYWRALSDVPYTALFSKTTYDDWRIITRYELSDADNPGKYTYYTGNDALVITPNKNTVFPASPNQYVGRLGYTALSAGTQSIIGVGFDYTCVAPTGWQFGMQTHNDNWSISTSPWYIASSGTAQTGCMSLTFSGVNKISFFIWNNGGAVSPYTGETGDAYIRITNLRVVTSTTNRIATTFTVNRAAGTSVTATVGSTARMYAGQRLCVTGASVSESVVVESVTNSTQFVATFVNSYVIGETVSAHVIYPDEIASGLVTYVNGVNSTQLSSSTALIQSPGIDLFDEIYEDTTPADILTTLAALGDNQSTPRMWEVGVWEDRKLFFRPRSSASNSWYVDITDLELERTIDTLYNSVYATYQDANSRTLRTSNNTDSTSVTNYGITRRTSISADTTSSTQAGVHRDVVLSDARFARTKAGFEIGKIFDVFGALVPLHRVRSGDTIVVRNLPPTLSTSINEIRSFRIGRTEHDTSNNTLTFEPEDSLDTLEFMLTRRNKGL